MQPWETLANWDTRTPDPPPDDRPGASERPWTPAGRPSWIEPERTGPPLWAILSLVLGVVLLVCCGITACIVVSVPDDARAPAAASSSPMPAVQVTGTCHSDVVGSYSLVASITVHNASSSIRRGSVWVNWPVTGQPSRTYSQSLALEPGQVREFQVNEPIDEPSWMALGQCDYGWSSDTD